MNLGYAFAALESAGQAQLVNVSKLTHFVLNFTEIPDNEYIRYFAPDYSLKIPNGNSVSSLVWNMIRDFCDTNLMSILFLCYFKQENSNSKSYLGSIKMQVFESLRSIQHAPGVQMQEVIILT